MNLVIPLNEEGASRILGHRRDSSCPVFSPMLMGMSQSCTHYLSVDVGSRGLNETEWPLFFPSEGSEIVPPHF